MVQACYFLICIAVSLSLLQCKTADIRPELNNRSLPEGSEAAPSSRTQVGDLVQQITDTNAQLIRPDQCQIAPSINLSPEWQAASWKPKMKTMTEIEKFVCIHRSSGSSLGRDTESFCDNFSKDYLPRILAAADAFQMPPQLLACMILIESGYQTRVRSPKGASGLAQIMPGTAPTIRNLARSNPGAWQKYQLSILQNTGVANSSTPTILSQEAFLGREGNRIDAPIFGMAIYADHLINQPAGGQTVTQRVLSMAATDLASTNDLYRVAAVGYNSGPRRIPEAIEALSKGKANITPFRETRGYIRKIDGCLNSGEFEVTHFGVKGSLLQKRMSECSAKSGGRVCE